MLVPAIIQSIQPILLSFLILPLSSYIHAEWTSIPIKYDIIKNDRNNIKTMNPEKSDGCVLTIKIQTALSPSKRIARQWPKPPQL